MNKFNFSKKLPSIIRIFLLLATLGIVPTYAQNPVNSGASLPIQLDKKELDAINRQPIALPVRSKDRVQGTEQRRLSYELKEENGTHIREYREGNKAVDIEVESSLGTHYHMSNPTNQTPTIRDQSIERVPAIRMSF